MKAVKNYYFILGVSPNAHQAEIEAAYESWMAAAMGDEFQALMATEKAEAYECLSNPKLRKRFDEMLGEPPQLSTGVVGNVHQFRSADAGVSVQLEFNKQLRKQKSRRKLVRAASAALILIAVTGYGIAHRGKYFSYFSKAPALPEVSAVPNLLGVPRPVPEPARVETARGARPVIRTYDVQTGGVVISDRATCRAQPSSLSRATATMPKDAAVLVTREARDENGQIWYYVRSSQFEGWASAGDIRVFR